jgi:hypothetical protein
VRFLRPCTIAQNSKLEKQRFPKHQIIRELLLFLLKQGLEFGYCEIF